MTYNVRQNAKTKCKFLCQNRPKLKDQIGKICLGGLKKGFCTERKNKFIKKNAKTIFLGPLLGSRQREEL